MDFKIQANRGSRLPDDWDQRKSTGQFQGAPEGENVKTLGEFRMEDDVLINPDRLTEFVRPGDNVVMVVNRVLDHLSEHQPAVLQHLASLAGIGGTGPVSLDILVYDND